jgi:hypothetical protein
MNFISTNAPLLRSHLQVDGHQLLFYAWLVGVAIFVISVVMLLVIKIRQWRYQRWVGGINARAAAHYQRFMRGARHQPTPPVWRRPDGRP